MPETALDPGVQEAIRDLLVEATDCGEEDVFLVRRGHQRVVHDTRLEYRTEDAEGAVPGILADISGGGLAFWIREKMARGIRIQVRRWPGTGEGGWIEGVVRHCEHGLKGYLVGIRFDHAIDFTAPPRVEVPEENLAAKKVKRRVKRQTSPLTLAICLGLMAGSAYYVYDRLVSAL